MRCVAVSSLLNKEILKYYLPNHNQFITYKYNEDKNDKMVKKNLPCLIL